MIVFRLLLLIIVLNLVRYFVIGLIEAPLIMNGLFGAMESSKQYFNFDFSNLDFAASFFYNFVMWAVVIVSFHVVHPLLNGSIYLKSLKVFGAMWLFFASVSAIYMNHYSHPKDFYVWSILDAVLVYTLLALFNGLLYPLIVRARPIIPE